MSDPGEEPEEDLLSYSVSEDEELQQYEQEQADAAEALSAQVGGSTVPLQHTPRAQSGDCSGQHRRGRAVEWTGCHGKKKWQEEWVRRRWRRRRRTITVAFNVRRIRRDA